MPSWWSGHAVGEPRLSQAHMDSVYSFLLKVAFVAARFLIALLIAYLAHYASAAVAEVGDDQMVGGDAGMVAERARIRARHRPRYVAGRRTVVQAA
jgi:hypothetical protein